VLRPTEVIIQSNPYHKLIRKIGYSVGLESVSNRVSYLTEYYANNSKISMSDWLDIVETIYNRKVGGAKFSNIPRMRGEKSAADHILDFYSSLDIMKSIGNEINPLPGLEILSILWRTSDNSAFRDKAINSFLCYRILDADGEIFLNCLLANFNHSLVKSMLKQMVSIKRRKISSTLTNSQAIKRIFEIISIKTYDISGGKKSPFQKRTTPLSGINVIEEEPSDDYIKKVIQTRKGWAKSIGLIDDSGKLIATNLLESLTKLFNRKSNEPFVFWPFNNDLKKLRIDPSQYNIISISPEDLLIEIMKSLHNLTIRNVSNKKLFENLKKYYELYKSGNIVKGALRHQLPIYIAMPCYYIENALDDADCPRFSDWIANDPIVTKQIDKIIIRGTEGGIVFRNE